MKAEYRGRVWKFGENVSTDAIAPGMFNLRARPNEYAKHCLQFYRPEFAESVQQGDILVADRNFGCGSSREIAPMLLKICGIEIVLAKTFSRLFYRNAVNIGLPIVECDTEQINDGDILIINTEKGTIIKEGDDQFRLEFKMSDKEIKIINAGGLLNYLEQNNGFEGL